SLRIDQFGKALVALGPLIEGVVGALSALIGVGLQGVAGAALVAGTAVSGFGLATLGMIAAVSGADKRLEQVGKAFDNLLKRFRQRTGPARDNFFAMVESGLERARALLPSFAQGTNQVSRGLRE